MLVSDFLDYVRATEGFRKAREEYDRYLVGLMARHLDEKIMLGAPTPETQAEVDQANAVAKVLLGYEDDDL